MPLDETVSLVVAATRGPSEEAPEPACQPPIVLDIPLE